MPFERERSFGCVFCVTGKEQEVADCIQHVCPEVRALALRQEKHKTVDGKKSRIKVVILPGYVFFEAPADSEIVTRFPRMDVIRVLKGNEKDWQLMGRDYDFARWVFAYDGLIGFSTAYRENEQVRIVFGPLKDMEGMISRIDKRGRSAQVLLNFNNREVKLWLGFDYLNALPGRSGSVDQE